MSNCYCLPGKAGGLPILFKKVCACRGATALGRLDAAPGLVCRATRPRSEETRFHRRDRGVHQSGAQRRTMPKGSTAARWNSARPSQDDHARRRPAPFWPGGAEGVRPADERRNVHAMGGKMSRAHTLERRRVVMGNLSSHKGPTVEQLIKAAGAELRYLPPYSLT